MTYERNFMHSLKIRENGIEAITEEFDIFKVLGVSEIVRIPIADYPNKRQGDQIFTHFNLPLSPDAYNLNVVFAKIMKKGFIKNQNEEELPLLSLENVWIAKTVDFKPNVTYKDVTSDDFLNPIGKVSNIAELQALILSRYKEVRLNSTKQEIIEQGVAIRKFKLVKKVSYKLGGKPT